MKLRPEMATMLAPIRRVDSTRMGERILGRMCLMMIFIWPVPMEAAASTYCRLFSLSTEARVTRA